LKNAFGIPVMREWLRVFKDMLGIAVTLRRAESGRAEKRCV
jgi:hypothetical protein